jgi:hypothetical protein
MTPDEISEIKRQFEEQSDWGFVSRYGRTGRITSLRSENKTVEIDTPHGSRTVKVGENTNIHQTTYDESRSLTFEDLTVGVLVTVDGETGTKENTEAGDIQVVPEGEGGFNIQPAFGSGPRMMPLLP